MKKIILLLSVIPLFVTGQTTPTLLQVTNAGAKYTKTIEFTGANSTALWQNALTGTGYRAGIGSRVNLLLAGKASYIDFVPSGLNILHTDSSVGKTSQINLANGFLQLDYYGGNQGIFKITNTLTTLDHTHASFSGLQYTAATATVVAANHTATSLLHRAAGDARWLGINSGWSTTGNSGTNSGINFIGTTNNVSLRFRTNDSIRMTVDSVGVITAAGSNLTPSYGIFDSKNRQIKYNDTTIAIDFAGYMLYDTQGSQVASYDFANRILKDIAGASAIDHSQTFVQIHGSNSTADLFGITGNDLRIGGDAGGSAGFGLYLKAINNLGTWRSGFKYLNSGTGEPNVILLPDGFGNVGVNTGTVTPSEKLHVIGSIRMVDGNEGSGKILTSDANGVGSWSANSALSTSLTNGYIYLGNGSNVATGVLPSLSATPGTFSVSNTGVWTVPNATTSLRGWLTSTDWNTFNNKIDNTVTTLSSLSTVGTLTAGAIPLSLTTGTLTVAKGGTGLGAITTGDILYGSATNTLSALADVAAGKYLRSGGVATAPLWSTATLPNTVTANAVMFGTASNVVGESANLTYLESTTTLSVTPTTRINVFGFGAGHASNTVPTVNHPVTIQVGTNGASDISIFNSTNNTAASARLTLTSNANNLIIDQFATLYTTSGAAIATGSRIYQDGAGISLAAINAAGVINFYTGGGASGNLFVNINASGRTFFGGSTSATALVHLGAGTASASTSPLKLNDGTLMTTPENGAVEKTSTAFFITPSGTNRYQIGTVLTATATIDFASTAAGAVTTNTMTLTGAADGDAISLGTPNGTRSTTDVSGYEAWVSATNVITIKFWNANTVGAVDPASGAFKVTVIKN